MIENNYQHDMSIKHVDNALNSKIK